MRATFLIQSYEILLKKKKKKEEKERMMTQTGEAPISNINSQIRRILQSNPKHSNQIDPRCLISRIKKEKKTKRKKKPICPQRCFSVLLHRRIMHGGVRYS